MSEETYIELGKLIKTLEQELLNSSLKVQSVELELKVVVHQENGEMRIHILDSGTETDWKNLHTLKVKVLQGTDDPPGGSGSRLRRDTDDASGPDDPPGGSGPDEPPGGSGTPPGGSGRGDGGPGEPPGGPGEPPGGSGRGDGDRGEPPGG